MAVTVELGQAGPGDVLAGTSPIAELMASLHALTESDHHPEARAFAREVGRRVPEELRDRIRAFSALWARLRCRLLFPLGTRLDAELDDELEALAALPEETFERLAAVGILGTGSGESIDLGAPGGVADFLERCERRSSTRFDLARRLVTDPVRLRAELIALLAACDEAFFREQWAEHRGELSRTAEVLRRRIAVEGAVGAVNSVSPTATVLPGDRVRFDKLQNLTIGSPDLPLLLVPSIRTWPHLTVPHGLNSPTVILYSVADEHDHRQLTLRQLSRRLAAINSPLRLEVCRHLLGEPITTSELARRMNTTEPQISRTLRQLREGGLVVSERDGRFLRHRLATDVIVQLGRDILATISR